MRARIWLGMALLGAAGLLLPGPADAGKKKGDTTEEEANAQRSQDVEDLALAYRLVELGEKNKAPEALITAAGLFRKLAKVKMAVVSEKPTIEVDKDAPEGTKALDKATESPDYQAEADRLFDQAAALAKDLKLDALIKEAKTRKVYRSPIGGPKRVNRLIGPHQTQTFHFKVHPHEQFHFHIKADRPVQITGVRSDNNVVWASGISANAHVTWHPGGKKGGRVPVTISIHNQNKQPASYHFVLN